MKLPIWLFLLISLLVILINLNGASLFDILLSLGLVLIVTSTYFPIKRAKPSASKRR